LSRVELCPDAKINAEQIRSVLEREVIIKEILEGDKADEAHRKMAKAFKKAEKNPLAKVLLFQLDQFKTRRQKFVHQTQLPLHFHRHPK
jgi:hypothetical protein